MNNDRNEYFVEPIIFDREKQGQVGFQTFEHPYELNNFFYQNLVRQKDAPKLSISVMTHRNIETLRVCIDCILKFADGIDYELVLLDNASEDNNETYDFLQSVPHKRKKVVQSTNNPGSYYNSFRSGSALWRLCEGDYILNINDDQFVTENSIQNMMRALDSDPSIGMVDPMCSAAWMGQDPYLEFHSQEEMHEAAKKFNVYDPKKWKERIYVAFVALMFRRELLGCFITPNPYVHELYAEISIRWEGYRAMMLGDTWVCHYHNYQTKETYGHAGDTEDKKAQREEMKRLSIHYHYGLDQFDEVCVFEDELVSHIKPKHVEGASKPCLLGVDMKAGQGILDAKNRLRTFGIFDTYSAAFTSKAKYYPILYTIGDEVFSDRIDYIQEYFTENTYNVVVCGEPVNTYGSPLLVAEKLYSFLKPGGILIFRVYNTDNYNTFMRSTKLGGVNEQVMASQLSQDELVDCLSSLGGRDIFVDAEVTDINDASKERLLSLLRKVNGSTAEDNLQQMTIRNYVYTVVKGK